MSAGDHLQPQLFEPGAALSAEEQDRRTHQRMGREVAAFGELAVSAPTEAARSIAATGVIMNQHETKSSGAAYAPGTRAKVERHMGYDDKPVYGAIRRSPSESAHYGRVNFHLKPEVKQRTTMYPGDSLNNAQDRGDLPAGALVDHLPRNVRDVAQGLVPAPLPEDEHESYESESYIEAHVHADPLRPETQGAKGAARVPLEDVSRVTIHEGYGSIPSRDHARPRNRILGEEFASLGLPVDHSLVDTVSQPPLPMEHTDGFRPPGERSQFRRRLVRHEDLTARDRWGSD